MVALRILSYLPNPRIWKPTIAARLCGVEVEVRGASPSDLSKWLWDFDARPIAEVPPMCWPWRNAPAASALPAEGSTRRRHVSRRSRLARSRPHSVPTAAPVFSNRTASGLCARVKDSFVTNLSGIGQALTPQRSFLVGDNITLADICFVAELCLFHNERARRSMLDTGGSPLLLGDDFAATYPRSANHFRRLLSHPAFAPDVDGYLEKIERSGTRRE